MNLSMLLSCLLKIIIYLIFWQGRHQAEASPVVVLLSQEARMRFHGMPGNQPVGFLHGSFKQNWRGCCPAQQSVTLTGSPGWAMYTSRVPAALLDWTPLRSLCLSPAPAGTKAESPWWAVPLPPPGFPTPGRAWPRGVGREPEGFHSHLRPGRLPRAARRPAGEPEPVRPARSGSGTEAVPAVEGGPAPPPGWGLPGQLRPRPLQRPAPPPQPERRPLGPKLGNAAPNPDRVRDGQTPNGEAGAGLIASVVRSLNDCRGKDVMLIIAFQDAGRKQWCSPLWKAKAALTASLGLPLLKKESHLLT